MELSPTKCPFSIYGKVHQAVPINKDGTLAITVKEDNVICPICNEVHENLHIVPAIEISVRNEYSLKYVKIGLCTFISLLLLISVVLIFT